MRGLFGSMVRCRMCYPLLGRFFSFSEQEPLEEPMGFEQSQDSRIRQMRCELTIRPH